MGPLVRSKRYILPMTRCRKTKLHASLGTERHMQACNVSWLTVALKVQHVKPGKRRKEVNLLG